MRTGRPTKRERPPFGERLAEARIKAGLSQAELAERLGVNQRLITHWERRSVTLKPDQIAALVAALRISADELLGVKPPRTTGPTGRVRQVFDAVAALPRRQQQKIVDVVEGFVAGTSR
ncbi:MAG: helix-turn-helix domain-containing protein [Bryobacterales bacterium]|nr:helix-turn-helix domain-containing protein [Bryobacterales bacterium]